MRGIVTKIIILLSCIALLGCAEHPRPAVKKSISRAAASEFHKFTSKGFTPVDTTGYVKKVDYFTIVFDPSASMTQVYTPSYECAACHIDYQESDYSKDHAITHGGSEFEGKKNEQYAMDCNRCHISPHYSKFKFAKELSQGLNKAIPNLDMVGTLRAFGYPAWDTLSYGLMEKDHTKYVKYDKRDYGVALEKLYEANGVSPLAYTLTALEKDFFEKEGNIAVIIISDGLDMDDREVHAAMALKNRFGDRICIYTILIGNDPFGRSVMDRMARAGECGMSLNGDHLLDRDNMYKFVRDVFLTRAPDGEDKDMDGVPDYCDDCPKSKQGVKVTDNGCWDLVLSADVLFDFDKYSLKPEGLVAMEQVTNLLKRNPGVNLHISGHTDNFGSMAYNIGLSKQRAQSGLNYLVKQGIDPGRITISWHSFTVPVASNETAAGRALNRRLEFKFKKPWIQNQDTRNWK